MRSGAAPIPFPPTSDLWDGSDRDRRDVGSVFGMDPKRIWSWARPERDACASPYSARVVSAELWS